MLGNFRGIIMQLGGGNRKCKDPHSFPKLVPRQKKNTALKRREAVTREELPGKSHQRTRQEINDHKKREGPDVIPEWTGTCL